MTLGTNTKLTPQKVIEMRRLRAEGWTQPRLARHFGVGVAQVGKVLRGEAWVGVTGGEPVVTEVEAQMRGLVSPATQDEIQASFARLQAMIEKDQIPSPHPLEILEGRLDTPTGAGLSRLEQELARFKPAPNAEKLLETLKDEHATNQGIHPGRECPLHPQESED